MNEQEGMQEEDFIAFLKHKSDQLHREVIEQREHMEKMINEAEQRCAAEKGVMWKAIAALGVIGALSGMFGPNASEAVHALVMRFGL